MAPNPIGLFSTAASKLEAGVYIVSPKFCSLALDEVELEDQYCEETCFEPKLTVLINKRVMKNSSFGNDVIKVRGRINVSF